MSEEEKEILNCMVQAWDENNAPLPGDICYQQVFDLLDKLGLDRPVRLLAFIDFTKKHRNHLEEKTDDTSGL